MSNSNGHAPNQNPKKARKTTTSVKVFSPSEALQAVDALRYPFQRPLRPTHVAFLAQEMRTDTFEMCAILIAHISNTGQKFLVDGQHRLWAIAQANVDVTLAVVEVECTSMEEVGLLYANTDAGLARSARDAMSFAASALSLSGHEFTTLNGACGLVIAGFEPASSEFQRKTSVRSRSLRVAVIERLALPFSQFRADIAKSEVMTKPLNRAAVAAVATITFKHQEDSAREFWGEMSRNNGLMPGDSRHALFSWLLANNANRYPPYIYARYVAGAWNAFQERRSYSRVALMSPDNPIVIQGTPYDGRRIVPWEEA